MIEADADVVATNLTLQAESITINGTLSAAPGSLRHPDGHSIVIQANHLSISGSVLAGDGASFNATTSNHTVFALAGGNGGGISIQATHVVIAPNATVASGSGGHGAPAYVEAIIDGKDDIGKQFVALGGDGGDAGAISILAERLDLDGALVMGSGGHGGDATVDTLSKVHFVGTPLAASMFRAPALYSRGGNGGNTTLIELSGVKNALGAGSLLVGPGGNGGDASSVASSEPETDAMEADAMSMRGCEGDPLDELTSGEVPDPVPCMPPPIILPFGGVVPPVPLYTPVSPPSTDGGHYCVPLPVVPELAYPADDNPAEECKIDTFGGSTVGLPWYGLESDCDFQATNGDIVGANAYLQQEATWLAATGYLEWVQANSDTDLSLDLLEEYKLTLEEYESVAGQEGILCTMAGLGLIGLPGATSGADGGHGGTGSAGGGGGQADAEGGKGGDGDKGGDATCSLTQCGQAGKGGNGGAGGPAAARAGDGGHGWAIPYEAEGGHSEPATAKGGEGGKGGQGGSWTTLSYDVDVPLTHRVPVPVAATIGTKGCNFKGECVEGGLGGEGGAGGAATAVGGAGGTADAFNIFLPGVPVNIYTVLAYIAPTIATGGNSADATATAGKGGTGGLGGNGGDCEFQLRQEAVVVVTAMFPIPNCKGGVGGQGGVGGASAPQASAASAPAGSATTWFTGALAFDVNGHQTGDAHVHALSAGTGGDGGTGGKCFQGECAPGGVGGKGGEGAYAGDAVGFDYYDSGDAFHSFNEGTGAFVIEETAGDIADKGHNRVWHSMMKTAKPYYCAQPGSCGKPYSGTPVPPTLLTTGSRGGGSAFVNPAGGGQGGIGGVGGACALITVTVVVSVTAPPLCHGGTGGEGGPGGVGGRADRATGGDGEVNFNPFSFINIVQDGGDAVVHPDALGPNGGKAGKGGKGGDGMCAGVGGPAGEPGQAGVTESSKLAYGQGGYAWTHFGRGSDGYVELKDATGGNGNDPGDDGTSMGLGPLGTLPCEVVDLAMDTALDLYESQMGTIDAQLGLVDTETSVGNTRVKVGIVDTGSMPKLLPPELIRDEWVHINSVDLSTKLLPLHNGTVTLGSGTNAVGYRINGPVHGDPYTYCITATVCISDVYAELHALLNSIGEDCLAIPSSPAIDVATSQVGLILDLSPVRQVKEEVCGVTGWAGDNPLVSHVARQVECVMHFFVDTAANATSDALPCSIPLNLVAEEREWLGCMRFGNNLIVNCERTRLDLERTLDAPGLIAGNGYIDLMTGGLTTTTLISASGSPTSMSTDGSTLFVASSNTPAPLLGHATGNTVCDVSPASFMCSLNMCQGQTNLGGVIKSYSSSLAPIATHSMTKVPVQVVSSPSALYALSCSPVPTLCLTACAVPNLPSMSSGIQTTVTALTPGLTPIWSKTVAGVPVGLAVGPSSVSAVTVDGPARALPTPCAWDATSCVGLSSAKTTVTTWSPMGVSMGGGTMPGIATAVAPDLLGGRIVVGAVGALTLDCVNLAGAFSVRALIPTSAVVAGQKPLPGMLSAVEVTATNAYLAVVKPSCPPDVTDPEFDLVMDTVADIFQTTRLLKVDMGLNTVAKGFVAEGAIFRMVMGLDGPNAMLYATAPWSHEAYRIDASTLQVVTYRTMNTAPLPIETIGGAVYVGSD